MTALLAGTAEDSAPRQFDISAHYDVMAQLDQDVHDDTELSRTEVQAALRLLGCVPERVFLPCFGTGRHIPFLLAAGVKEIVGVDLSPACVAKAQRLFGHQPGVQLAVGDLLTWENPGRKFDAVILLGNSFADAIDRQLLRRLTRAMTQHLRSDGKFVMDYIGEGYLGRCADGVTSVWDAVLNGSTVKDARTPSFDSVSRIMTISVVVRLAANISQVVWNGSYQKLILSEQELEEMFLDAGIQMRPRGVATQVNADYYRGHEGELGMIARSTWWVGTPINQ